MKNTKIIILSCVSILFWLADWVAIKALIYGSHPIIFWLWPSVFTVFAISFSTLFLLVNKNRTSSILWTVIGTIGYFVIMPLTLYPILGGLIFLGLSILFEQRIWSEEKNTLNFSISRIVSNSVSVMVYCLLIILGVNVYNSIEKDFITNPDAYYQKLGQAAAKTVPYFTKGLPTGIDFNQTLDQFFVSEAEKANPDIRKIPPAQQERLISQYRDQFFNQFQVKASGNQTLSDVFAQVAIDKLKSSGKGYEQYFPLVFTASVVALLWLFAFLLRWTTLLVSWLIFRGLLMIGFFKLSKVPVEVEKLSV